MHARTSSAERKSCTGLASARAANGGIQHIGDVVRRWHASLAAAFSIDWNWWTR